MDEKLSSSSVPAPVAASTDLSMVQKPGYAPVKKEYIDSKSSNPTSSSESSDEIAMKKSRNKYRGINRERGKKMAKKCLSWPVKEVCEVRSEAIIWAVEQFPCLWDLSSDDYRDRSKRRQGWYTVGRMLIDDFENKDAAERQSIEKEIQNKWKNIRDCYVRDIRRKSGEPVKSRGKRTREYMHAGLLSFLDCSYVVQSRTARLSSQTVPASENSHDFVLDNVVKPFLDQTAEVNCDWIKQEILEEKLGMILEERSLSTDEDSNFLSSLLPTIRGLDPKQKVEFRLEVLQALRQIATKSPLSFSQPDSPDVTGSSGTFSSISSSDSGVFSETSGSSRTFFNASESKSHSQQIPVAENLIFPQNVQQDCLSPSSLSSSPSLTASASSSLYPQRTSDTQ